jgi:hypothetical protein
MLTSNDFLNANTGVFDPRVSFLSPLPPSLLLPNISSTCMELLIKTSSAGHRSRMARTGCFSPCSSPLCTCQESHSCCGAKSKPFTSSTARPQIICSAGNQCRPTPLGKLTAATRWILSSITTGQLTLSSVAARTIQSVSITGIPRIQSATSSSPCTPYASNTRS